MEYQHHNRQNHLSVMSPTMKTKTQKTLKVTMKNNKKPSCR